MLIPEARDVEDQLAIGELGLEAEFIAVDLFRAIGVAQFARVAGGRGTVEWLANQPCDICLTVKAAGLVAARPAGVDVDVVAGFIAERGRWAEVIELRIRHTAIRHIEQREARRTDRELTADVLHLIGVARAQRHLQRLGQPIVELRIERPSLCVRSIVGLEIRRTRCTNLIKEAEEALWPKRFGLFLIGKGANHVVQAVVHRVARELELLAVSVEARVALRVRDVERRPVKVRRILPAQIAVRADRLERRGPHVEREGQAVAIGPRLFIERIGVDAGRALAVRIGIEAQRRDGREDCRIREQAVRQHTHQLREIGPLVVTAIIKLIVRCEIAFRLQPQLDHARLAIEIAQIGHRVRPCEERLWERVWPDLHKAVALLDLAGDLHGQSAHGRQVQDRLALPIIIIAIADLSRATRFACWLLGDEVDGTGQRVAAIERALRPAQHFYAFQIRHVKDRALRLGDINAIKVEADRRFPSDSRVDRDRTTNGDLRDRLVGRRALNLHVRRDRAETVNRTDVARFQIFAADCRNGERNVLNVFRTLLRGDDDVTNAACILSHTVLRDGWHGHCRAGEQSC